MLARLVNKATLDSQFLDNIDMAERPYQYYPIDRKQSQMVYSSKLSTSTVVETLRLSERDAFKKVASALRLKAKE